VEKKDGQGINREGVKDLDRVWEDNTLLYQQNNSEKVVKKKSTNIGGGGKVRRYGTGPIWEKLWTGHLEAQKERKKFPPPESGQKFCCGKLRTLKERGRREPGGPSGWGGIGFQKTSSRLTTN